MKSDIYYSASEYPRMLKLHLRHEIRLRQLAMRIVDNYSHSDSVQPVVVKLQKIKDRIRWVMSRAHEMADAMGITLDRNNPLQSKAYYKEWAIRDEDHRITDIVEL